MRILPIFFIAAVALLAQPTLPGPVTIRPPVDDSSAASIRLREKLANGTEYFEWKAPASLLANVTLIGPDALPPSSKCLLVDASGATSYVACSGATSAMIFASDYDFAAQTPGGSLTAATPASVTLTPCPAGVSHDNTDHKLRIFGGTGTAEAVLITGGDCESAAASGTIEFTPGNDHSGAWQVGSATFGAQEAVHVAAPLGTVFIKGSNTLYATITIRTTAAKTQHISLKGIDRASSIIVADSTLTGPGILITDYNDAAEKWTSAQYGISDLMFDFNAASGSDILQIGDGTDIDVGNGPLIHNISTRGGKRCIYAQTTGKLWLSNSHFDKLDAADDCIYLDVTASPLAMGGWTIHDVEIGTNETGGAATGSGIHIVCNHATLCNWTNLAMVEILGKWQHSLLVENTVAVLPAVGAGMYVTVDKLITEAFTSSHTVKFLNSSFNQIRSSWISNMNASGGTSALYVENGYEFLVNDNYLYSNTTGADVSLNGGGRLLFGGNRFIGSTKAFAFDVTNDTIASTAGFNHFAQIAHNQNLKWLAFTAAGSLNAQPLVSAFRVLFKESGGNPLTLENGDTGATNPKKPIFVDSTGTLRLLNNAYSAYILSVSDTGFVAWGTVAFAGLGTLANSFQVYCSDCKLTSSVNNTCATGGTGALAVRINSVWRCFDNQSEPGMTLDTVQTVTAEKTFAADQHLAPKGATNQPSYSLVLQSTTGASVTKEAIIYAAPSGDLEMEAITGVVALLDGAGNPVLKTGPTVITPWTNIIPGATNSYDLGNTSYRFRDAWFTGTITATGGVAGTVTTTSAQSITGEKTFVADQHIAPKGATNQVSYSLVFQSTTGAGATKEAIIYAAPAGDLEIEAMTGTVALLDGAGNPVLKTEPTVITPWVNVIPGATNSYDLGSTSYRWKAGWFTGAVTATGGFAGNASTSTALAADPTACGTGEFVTDIAANGTLTCATTSGLSVTVTCGAGTAVKNITFVNGLATSAGCGVP